MLDVIGAYPAVVIGGAFAFGLLVGSFLNVVILRLPLRLQWAWERDSRELLGMADSATEALPPPGIVVERSHCPKCGHVLAAWENIPLVSYVALRGRCRKCRAAISIQYPMVELLTGVAFALVVWRFGLTPQGLAALLFSGVLIAAAGIDWRTTLLPDDLTLPLLWIGLGLSLVPVFAAPSDAIVGAIVGYGSLWSVYWAFKLLTGKEGMGYGDFKLLAAIGAWCGVGAILPVLLMSSVVGAILGSLAILIQGRDRATPIPFGPYLAVAGWIQLVAGVDLLAAYLTFAGLAD
jgi:leader peptidase (prepilin peptidase)/N-methyltransferase